MVLRDSNPAYAQAQPEDPAQPDVSQQKFGVSIRPLNDVEREGVASQAKSGVKVTRVESGSFAEDIGMLDGDIIVSINRMPVNSVDDVRRVQSTLKGGQRGGVPDPPLADTECPRARRRQWMVRYVPLGNAAAAVRIGRARCCAGPVPFG